MQNVHSPPARPTLTLVIPSLNMGDHVLGLLESLKDCGLYEELTEVLIVDDASTDGTAEKLSAWKQSSDSRSILRIRRFESNQGRFKARLAGAEESSSEFCLFIDARVRVTSEFREALWKILAQHRAAVASVRIDEAKTLFNLYWQRTHERIFAKTAEGEKSGLLITAENFSEHIVGTTALLCDRKSFISACEPFKGQRLESDDIALLENLVKTIPIYRDSSFFIMWEPRQNLLDFLQYIFWQRGISFAEYHLLKKWSALSFVFMLGVLALLGLIPVLIVHPVCGLWLAWVGVVLVYLSTLLFSRGLKEFLSLSWFHVLVIASYGFGSLFGFFRILFRSFRAKT